MKGVHGYKVFSSEWVCGKIRHMKKYTCPGKFEENVQPILCHRGMHFCESLIDCFNYYSFDSNNKVAEVIAYGKVETDGVKSVTDKLYIVREISWDEVLRLVNEGKNCTGFCNTGGLNTGDFNTGPYNTGAYNAGHHNTGRYNIGNYNTGFNNLGSANVGDNNTGYRNTGDYNSGCRNTGDNNIGNYNTGDWNKSSFNTGCFMTYEQKIMMFNKPSDWTYRMWLDSDARFLLNYIPRCYVEWIESAYMTNEEKKAHPEHEKTGGYLKELDESESAQIWWDKLNDESKEIIKSLPNFNPDIFYQCTGIKVDE